MAAFQVRRALLRSPLLRRPNSIIVLRHCSTQPSPPPPPPILSDERITVSSPTYNRWLQLVPTVTAGTALGTYFAVPGVLGPHICRAQGVVAQSVGDFAMSEIVPLAATMSLVAGVLAAGLANYSAKFGVRRVALAGSVLFPAGIYALPAIGVHANNLSMYAATTVAVGGVGFYCIYPQLPPLLSGRWFPDKPGLAVSIYFCGFGGGMIFASKIMQSLLAHYRQPPTRLSGLEDTASLNLTLGAKGERLATVADGEAPVEVVLATTRDLVASGFSHLEEGVFVVGSGSNGVVETMLGMGGLTFAMTHLAGWSYRLPHPDFVPCRAHPFATPSTTDGVADAATADASDAPATTKDEAAVTRPDAGLLMGDAQLTPHFYLLFISTGALGMTGLPFLLSGQFMINDIFGGSTLNAAAIGAAAVAFPSMVGKANMSGRLLWGPVSDRLGRGGTFALFGILGVPALMLLPQATAMVSTQPQTALYLFQAASLLNVGVFAGGPVLLSPAVIDRFGPRDATAIYGRLWMMLPLSNYVGATLVTKVRDYSYAKHALIIAETCDEEAFVNAFGAPKAEAASLVQSKVVTLPLLLRIAPEGTVDPSPLLYDDAFYTLAGFSALAFACNVTAYRLPVPRPRM